MLGRVTEVEASERPKSAGQGSSAPVSPSKMDVAAFCMSPLCFRRTRLATSGSPSPIMDVRSVTFSSSGAFMAVIVKLGTLKSSGEGKGHCPL